MLSPTTFMHENCPSKLQEKENCKQRNLIMFYVGYNFVLVPIRSSTAPHVAYWLDTCRTAVVSPADVIPWLTRSCLSWLRLSIVREYRIAYHYPEARMKRESTVSAECISHFHHTKLERLKSDHPHLGTILH